MVEIINVGTGSSGNCYIVKTQGGNFLLDAGINLNKVIKYINLNDVDFAFISHEHKDHADFMSELEKRGLNVIKWVKDWKYETIKVPSKTGLHYIGFKIPVHHGKTMCSGLAVNPGGTNELILYMTDFSICDFQLSKFAFTTIIIECNYIEDMMTKAITETDGYAQEKYKRQFNTHMGLTGLLRFLDTLNLNACEQILLVHKSADKRISNGVEMGATVFAKYGIKTGVCKHNGGIAWFENFNTIKGE